MKQTIGTIIIGLALLVGVVLGYLQSEKWLKNEAVQGCMVVGVDKYNGIDGASGASVPNIDSYKTCMSEKGYTTSLNK